MVMLCGTTILTKSLVFVLGRGKEVRALQPEILRKISFSLTMETKFLRIL